MFGSGLDDYEIVKEIGNGSFSTVFLAVHKQSGQEVVLKRVNSDSSREAKLMERIQHPLIVRLYDYFTYEPYEYLVLEYVPNGNLSRFVFESDAISESSARKIFIQLVEVLEYLHASKIAHHDLKPENILLDDNNNIKLIDFGLSAQIGQDEEEENNSICGSPLFIAPEALSGLQTYEESDIWSLGIILYALVTKRFPFDSEDIETVFDQISTKHIQLPEGLSPSLTDLLRKMLDKNPLTRISLSEIKSHQWYSPFMASNMHKAIENSIEQAKEGSFSIFEQLKQMNLYQSEDTTVYRILYRKKLIETFSNSVASSHLLPSKTHSQIQVVSTSNPVPVKSHIKTKYFTQRRCPSVSPTPIQRDFPQFVFTNNMIL